MRAIVFDFDGVIVDSEPIHEEGLRRALAPVGIPVREGLSIGLADEDAIRLVCEEAGTVLAPDVVARMLREKGRYVEDVFAQGEARPYPGAIELVRSAAAALPIAICSAAYGHEIRAVLRGLGIDGLFRTIVAFGDVPAAKPDPAGYRLAAQRLGLEPEDCLAIEDSPRGVTAAVAAGLTSVAVAHTTEPSHLAHAHHVELHIGKLSVHRLFEIHAARPAPL